MYKNIRIISLPNKNDALIALRSVAINMDPDAASMVINSAPGVVMRGIFTPFAERIKKKLEEAGAKVVLE